MVMAESRKRQRSSTQGHESGRKNAKIDTAPPGNTKSIPEARTYTTFSWLNTSGDVFGKGELKPKLDGVGQRDPGKQGPHVIADVTLNQVVDMRQKKSGSQGVKDLLGTGFAPSPEVVKAMMGHEKQLKNADKGHDLTETHSKAFLDKYEKKYKKAFATPLDDSVALQRRVRTLMNMQPTATYAWGLGRATSAEMAGKGESTKVALEDMEAVSKRGSAAFGSLTTVDFGFERHFPEPLRKAVHRNIEDLGAVYQGKAPRPLTKKDIE
jgi:hypothetical protein